MPAFSSPGKYPIIHIAIDPGHGGHDMGCRFPGGGVEKILTLDFSRLLKKQLQTRYPVSLTRADDYGPDMIQRLCTAAEAGASIFISIHARPYTPGGSSGIRVFYGSCGNESDLQSDSQSDPKKAVTGSKIPLWDDNQCPYQKKSRVLAETLSRAFSQKTGQPNNPPVSMPFFILRGASMPAVVIEINHDAPLEKTAVAASDGIIAFIRRSF